MQIKTQEVRNVVRILDEIVEQYKEDSVKKAFKELKPLVHEAVAAIRIVKGETRGTKPNLTLEQKVLALRFCY